MLSKLWNLSGAIGFHQNVRAAAAPMAQAAAFQTPKKYIELGRNKFLPAVDLNYSYLVNE